MLRIFISAILALISSTSYVWAQDGPPGAALPVVAQLAGSYKGHMPCSECRTIATEMELSYVTDTTGEYVLRLKYMGKGDKEVLSSSRSQGNFKVFAEGSGKQKMTLLYMDYDTPEKETYYQLKADNNLLPLDADKKPVDAETDCTMKKELP